MIGFPSGGVMLLVAAPARKPVGASAALREVTPTEIINAMMAPRAIQAEGLLGMVVSGGGIRTEGYAAVYPDVIKCTRYQRGDFEVSGDLLSVGVITIDGAGPDHETECGSRRRC